jgi:hypothetical protein
MMATREPGETPMASDIWVMVRSKISVSTVMQIVGNSVESG